MLRRAAALLLGAVALAAVANAVSPVGLSWAGSVRQRAAARVRAAGLEPGGVSRARAATRDPEIIVFDARPRPRYERGHLPGALSFPAGRLHEAMQRYGPLLAPEQPILVYCSGRDCDDSRRVGRFLRENGFKNIEIFVGGYRVWRR
jgi:rhodanese-related sulfurtransferase